MTGRMSNVKIGELTKIIDNIPGYSDILIELKGSLHEAIRLPRDDAITFLRIRLEPSVLINDDVTPKRFIYRTIIRILNELNIPATITPGTSIVETVIDIIFAGDELKDSNTLAKTLYETHIEGMSTGEPTNPLFNNQATGTTTSSPQDARHQNYGAPEFDSLTKKLSSATYNFRDRQLRFSGSYDSTLSLHRFMQLFDATVEQYDVPDTSCVPLMMSALQGVALDFYFDTIKNNAQTKMEAYNLLKQRFDSASTRAQAQSFLESLTLESIQRADNCSTARALELAQQKIANIAPMCGPEYRHESHKARWLSNILRNEKWAQLCCERRLTEAQDYSTFISALNSTLTQQTITLNNGNRDESNAPGGTMAIPTYYGQRCATPTRPFRIPYRRRNNGRRMTAQQLRAKKQRTRCLKCGEYGHWRAECPKNNMTMSDAINARIAESGDNLSTIKNTLLAIVAHEDEHTDYLNDLDQINENDEPIIESTADNWLAHNLDPFDTCLAALDISNNFSIENNDERSNRQDNTIVNNFVFLASPLAIRNGEDTTFNGALIDTGAQRSVIGSSNLVHISDPCD